MAVTQNDVMRWLDPEEPDYVAAAAALGQEPTSRELLDRLSELYYADWRVEVLGRASMQT